MSGSPRAGEARAEFGADSLAPRGRLLGQPFAWLGEERKVQTIFNQRKKKEKGKGTHNNNSLFQQGDGRKFRHSSETLPVQCGPGSELLGGFVPVFFFNNHLVLEILDGEASEKARGGGLAVAGCREALGLLLLCCPGCTGRAHIGAAQESQSLALGRVGVLTKTQ